jgi:leucyl aminopeptidase
MNTRIRIDISVSRQAAGKVVAWPLTQATWRSLVEGQGTGSQGIGPHGANELPEGCLDALRALAGCTRFEANDGQSLPVLGRDGRLALLVGLGEKLETRTLRVAAARAAEQVPAQTAWSLIVPTGANVSDEALARAACEGVATAPYRFKRSNRPGPEPAGACTLVTTVGEAVIERAKAGVEGQLLARDLVNTPAADLGPVELGDAARAVGERYGWKVTRWTGAELDAEGFGLVAGVGRAASRPPTFTVIENRPGTAPEIGLVGKGVVFDTGGLDIKTGGYMQLMRKDMGGAGTLIGALDAVGRMGTKRSFMAIVPAAENAIGPDAMRPGDVLTGLDGQTVEIGNTDAEGRLLLGDGLAYARRRGASRLLDLATLTGAARVALGPDVPALFGTDEELVAQLREHSLALDEELWRMPLVDAYDATIDTPFADVNNSGSERRGGAITAALFLRRFVGDTPWAHVDLYAWEDRGRPGTPRGANGMTVRTVAELLAD